MNPEYFLFPFLMNTVPDFRTGIVILDMFIFVTIYILIKILSRNNVINYLMDLITYFTPLHI